MAGSVFSLIQLHYLFPNDQILLLYQLFQGVLLCYCLDFFLFFFHILYFTLLCIYACNVNIYFILQFNSTKKLLPKKLYYGYSTLLLLQFHLTISFKIFHIIFNFSINPREGVEAYLNALRMFFASISPCVTILEIID